MCHERIGTDRERACRLDRIRQLQFTSSAKPGCALCNLRIQIHDEPRFEGSSVLFSEDFVASAQRSGQYLGKRHRRNCETHKPFVMRLEYRPECRSELGMILEHVNNRGGVNQEKGVLRQPL